MALPASQYSVLDAKKIDRIDDHTFRCYVNAISFLNLTIEPILTVAVEEGSRGPTVKLLDTRVCSHCLCLNKTPVQLIWRLGGVRVNADEEPAMAGSQHASSCLSNSRSITDYC